MDKPSYFTCVGIAISFLANAVLGGWPDETISARAYRLEPKSKFWRIVRQLLDRVCCWQVQHCAKTHIWEKDRARSKFPDPFMDRDAFMDSLLSCPGAIESDSSDPTDSPAS